MISTFLFLILSKLVEVDAQTTIHLDFDADP